jgi:hypothetical protein
MQIWVKRGRKSTSMETVAAQIISFRNLLPAQDTVFYKNAQELNAVVQLSQPQIEYGHH